MVITSKRLARRTVLRGMGVTIALPFLEAMVPVRPVLARAALTPKPRLIAIEMVHGSAGSTAFGQQKNLWSPAEVGSAFDLTPSVLSPLEHCRQYVTIVSHTDVRNAEAFTAPEIGGDHFRSAAVFLTQAHPHQTQGSDLKAGTSLDQLVAQKFGQDTPIPSMQLCIENVDQAGGCFYGYSCAYTDSISWKSPSEPLPMVRDPRLVFDQLFGVGATPEARAARRRKDRSILDWVNESVGRLNKKLGAADRARLDDYLEDVREVERRIQKVEEFNSSGEPRELPGAPVGVPDSYEEHVKLMFDLQAIAFASDITRVFAFKMSRDVSNRVYSAAGVTTGFHIASHHQDRDDRILEFAKINKYHVSLLPYLFDRLKRTADGEGNLLENAAIIYGSPMGNSNVHNHKRCPLLVAGHARGALKGNLHLKAADGTPMANVMLALLQKMGLEIEQFGDSTGAYELNSVPLGTTAVAGASGASGASGSMGAAGALLLAVLTLTGGSVPVRAQATPASRAAAPVAAAAQAQDLDEVRTLLKQGVDVNAAQGDGMTALHWAALYGNSDLASMLLYAGANVRATTRLGAYTPLHLASQAGAGALVDPLIKSGASVATPTATGTTPLMLAAASGSADAVKRLVAHGADLNATENVQSETALMFAAAANRAEVVQVLMAAGADKTAATKITDLGLLTAAPGEEAFQQSQRRPEAGGSTGGGQAQAGGSGNRGAAAPQGPRAPDLAGVTRPFRYNELIGRQGGLTALLFAARQGATETARVLVEGGADVNQVSQADNCSPMLMAAINGHFDLARYFLEHGGDPGIASDAGATPLYAALNVQWAPKAFYPQPRAYLQQHSSYLDLMTALLDKGADPNVRLKRKIWYSSYNFDNLRLDEIGATPFWRAAYASDIEAMKLLVARGADPHIPTSRPAGRSTRGDPGQPQVPIEDKSGKPPVPVGGPGVPPLQAAAGSGYGEGFAGNAHRFAPTGMLAAVKYLVDELHADVNAEDHDGNTALHHAAARGDVEMILYLVSKGADPKAINREGQSTADMANGPVQRTQPYPEARDLLVKLGAINHNKCVSC